MEHPKSSPPLVALLPLILFVATFLGAGILLGDSEALSFYALPSPIAAVVGIAAAFLLFRTPISEKVNHLITGCGQPQIVLMCIIYLLAGGFATLTKEIGGVQAVVAFGSQYLSMQLLYAGVFVLTAFVSFSAGTSVGAITAIAPIAAGFLTLPGINGPLIAASLLGGAMFGDNLSLISDTTIAATQTQECDMKDKFRVNSRIAIPAALATVVLLIGIGTLTHSSGPVTSTLESSPSLLFALPYVVVIALAVLGVHVTVTLFAGIVVAAVIALSATDMTLLASAKTIYQGFLGMNEIFLLSMLSAGLITLIEKEGGIRYLIEKTTAFASSKARSFTGIAALVSVVDAAIANNTVAILVTGPIANRLRKRYSIEGAHSACVLDISSCIVQGIIPWGAQVLILLQQMGPSINYFEMISQAYYLGILGVTAILMFAVMPRWRPSSP